MILWDTKRDHEADARCQKLSEFFRALADAERSGKPYRVSYIGPAHPDIFESWAHAVWSILDGRRITKLIVEEYSNCCRGAGPLSLERDFYHRNLWTQSRAFGGEIHATSQRPQLISTDALGNTGHIWAGGMDTRAARIIGDEIDVPWRELKGLGVGWFYHRPEGGDAELNKVFEPI